MAARCMCCNRSFATAWHICRLYYKCVDYETTSTGKVYVLLHTMELKEVSGSLKQSRLISPSFDAVFRQKKRRNDRSGVLHLLPGTGNSVQPYPYIERRIVVSALCFFLANRKRPQQSVQSAHFILPAGERSVFLS